MEKFKQQIISIAYSEFGIKAIDSITFEQAFAILDKMQQLNIAPVVGRSEQLFCHHEGKYTLKNDGNCCKCHLPLNPKAK